MQKTLRKNWSQGSDKSDPYLSPVLADVSVLKTSGVSVNCMVGMVIVFPEKCKQGEVKGKWLLWDGMMHDFPLAARYGLKEGNEGRAWVKKVLRDVS